VEVRLKTSSQTEATEMEFAPGNAVPVVFEIDRPNGSTEAAIELAAPEPDPYPRDDRFLFLASAPDPLEVLALVVDPVEGKDAEEVFFLKQALDTGSSTEWVRYSLIDVGTFAINPGNLSKTVAVFIPAGAFADPATPWEVLTDYIREGGLVVATMGEDAVRGAQKIRSLGLPMGDYSGIAGRTGSNRFFVGPLPDDSPLAPVFEGPAERDLYLMSVSRYTRLRLSEEGSPLLLSEEGDPLVAKIPHGKGNLVLATFPWDRSASDFPLRPSFLPIVREVFGLASRDAVRAVGAEAQTAVPAAESVTSIVDLEHIQMQLSGGSPAREAAARTEARLAGNDKNLIHLAPWLLLATILLLILESILARRLIAST
jgi:hypothetical protein